MIFSPEASAECISAIKVSLICTKILYTLGSISSSRERTKGEEKKQNKTKKKLRSYNQVRQLGLFTVLCKGDHGDDYDDHSSHPVHFSSLHNHTYLDFSLAVLSPSNSVSANNQGPQQSPEGVFFGISSVFFFFFLGRKKSEGTVGVA